VRHGAQRIVTVTLVALALTPLAGLAGGAVTRAEAAPQGPVAEALAVSQVLFGADAAAGVVLTRSDLFADALGGSALAGRDAPLLLTPGAALDPAVAAEIDRVLGARGTVWVLGSERAVSGAVTDELARAGHQVRRLAGADRIETSIAIARELAARGAVEEVLIARADDWADAVTGGAYAAAAGVPILLTPRDGLDPRVAALLAELAPARRFVLGGPAAVSDAVVAQAGAERVWGADRAATAVAIAERLWGRGAAEAGQEWVATHGYTEDGWAYALASTPWSAAHRAPQLLVGATLPDPVRAYLDRLGYPVPGGAVRSTGAVPSPVAEQLRELLQARSEPARPAPAPNPSSEQRGVRVAVGADVQALVDAAPAGSTFVFDSGVHREVSITPRSGDRFTGQPGAVLSGARVLDGWRREGGAWAVGGQTQQGEVILADVLEDGRERDAHPEELFVGGKRFRHVGSRGELGPGRWFFDYDADRIWLGEDPAGRLVETSVTPYAFVGRGTRDVTVADLTVEHYANPPLGSHAAISAFRTSGWTLANLDVRANHGAGIGTGTGLTIRDSKITDNGQIGIAGTDTSRDAQPEFEDGLVVTGNEIARNRQLGYEWGFEGGGTKFILTRGMRFTGNHVHSNNGPGAWWDIDNLDAVIEGNHVHENLDAGIFYEISHGARITGNHVHDNGLQATGDTGAGVWVSTSARVEVAGNVLYGNRHEVLATHNDRGAGLYGLHETADLWVHDNDMTVDRGEPGLRVTTGDASYYTSRGNRFTANTYRLSSLDDRTFFWDGMLTASGWQAKGNDTTGTFTTAAR
jgi:putative cell wall-binding protein